jgi:hypothetical protein
MMKRRAMCVSAVIALASLGSSCSGPDDPDTFDVAGKYLYPVPGATSNGDCRSVGLPGEGDAVLIENVGRTSSQVVARGRLEAGHLDASITSYGTDAVCVYPFTVSDVPSGGIGYGASVEGESGLLFSETDADALVVFGGLPPLKGDR